MRTAAKLTAAIVSAGLVAAGALAHGDAAAPTKVKGTLTVAIELGNPGFAEGTLAKPHGFSVDIAAALARRMGLKIRFVDYPFARLFVPGPKPYDAAFEFVTIVPGRERFVDFSIPYLTSTQGVLLAKDIKGPVTLARLRKLQVCAKEVTTGSDYVQEVLRPTALFLQYPTAGGALNALSQSICDAFVFDLPALLAAKDEAPAKYGEVAGRLGPAEYYGAVMRTGSPLKPAVDRAIESLRKDGTIAKIAAENFGPKFSSAPLIK
jgi:polar amino acid transport system substrate-binding protein